MLGLSCNVSIMYTELPFAERFDAAARDGFRCVEFWGAAGPEARSASEAVARLRLAVSVINVDAGPLPDDFGQLGNPDRTGWWREAFVRTADLATEIGCQNINVLAGGELPVGRDRQLRTIMDNLSWALASPGAGELTLLLEPLNGTDRARPLIRRTEDVQAIRAALGEPASLRLLFDAYHVSQEHDDLIAAYREALPTIGHVQLADFPGRHQPGTGQIDFLGFVDCVLGSGYGGWLGLEYAPLGPPRDALGWVLDIPALQRDFRQLAR
jgi:hydroxypyruvate isomerase